MTATAVMPAPGQRSPVATSTQPTARLRVTGWRRKTAASAVAMTTLVSRTAATDAAGASRSAASTSAYATNMPNPAPAVQRENPARTTSGPRVHARAVA